VRPQVRKPLLVELRAQADQGEGADGRPRTGEHGTGQRGDRLFVAPVLDGESRPFGALDVGEQPVGSGQRVPALLRRTQIRDPVGRREGGDEGERTGEPVNGQGLAGQAADHRQTVGAYDIDHARAVGLRHLEVDHHAGALGQRGENRPGERSE
jgi:hypothetical protein